MGYLFGDLLSVGYTDVIYIYLGVVVIAGVLTLFWRQLLSSTVNEELAAVEGINIDLMRLIVMLLVGLVIALGMKFVGALIITSLLIIPAAAARRLTASPLSMVCVASVIGSIAVLCGLFLSWHYDTPAGPSVVVSASAMFVLTQFKSVR
jgi:zinc transport system permease protein